MELTDRVVFTMANGQIRVFREHIREWHEMEFLRPEKKDGKQ